MAILELERIQLQATVTDKTDAIKQAGDLLVNNGCVSSAYVDGMLTREQSMSTYLDNGVAIPHGMNENKQDIIKSAISVLQVPAGVEWEPGEIVYLVVGIASSSDEHIDILTALAEVVEDEERTQALIKTDDPHLILKELGAN